MSVSESDYKSHKKCTAGDVIKARSIDGIVYRGTVIRTEGSTVYVNSNDNKMLEFRRLKNNSQPVIVLAIHGKEVKGEEIVAQGRITKESAKLSFDKQIESFEADETTHKIG